MGSKTERRGAGPGQLSTTGTTRPVFIAEYDESWPAQYDEWQARLAKVFGPYAVEIEHMGSTAVPALAAKPVIDIGVSLREYPLPDEILSGVEALGFTHKGEYGIPGRHYFTSYEAEATAVHLHAYMPGSEELTAQIVFRDYLRAHPEAARAYETLKRDLAARYTNQREVYTESKRGFVMETLRKARE